MQTLRTPDERFEGLDGYPFEPHYAEIADRGDGGTLRVHYLDEGPADAAPVLLMHGEPSWSYLYRHMIPPLVAAGHRVIAPDLVGFGRSDKPTEQSDYTYARHVEWMRELLFDHLDLRGITFFGQDWGGLVGLRLLALDPDRYARVAIGNTGLPTGHGPASDAFMAWQKFSQETPVFDIGFLINAATTTDLSAEVIAGYDAPFPDDSYKAGARIFPTLVPTRPARPGQRRQRRRLGGARCLRQAVPAVLQRQRPGHQGRRRPVPRQGARHAGATPRDDRGRRSLPPGGSRPRTRRAADRLHRVLMDMSTDRWRDLSRRAAFESHRLIGWIYWDPLAIANYAALGVPDGLGYYIATRGATLGHAGNEVVTAAFYSIHPDFVGLRPGPVPGEHHV